MSLLAQRLSLAATSAQISGVQAWPRPYTGSNAFYRAVVNIRNGRGEMEDPDGDTVYMRLVQPGGVALPDRLHKDYAGAAELDDSTNPDFPHATYEWMQQTAKLGKGRYEVFVRVNETDLEQNLSLEVAWVEKGKNNYETFRARVTDAADADAIESAVGRVEDAIGSPSVDLATDLAAVGTKVDDLDTKLGTPAGASVSADILALDTKLGTPAGADVSADIAEVLDAVEAISSGAPLFTRKGTFSQHPAVTDSLIEADPDSHDVTCSSAGGDDGTDKVMHILEVVLPDDATNQAKVESLTVALKWSGQISTGTGAGVSYWMLSRGSETAGQVPSVDAVAITGEVAESTVLTTHSLSGLVRSSAYASGHGSFKLLLVGSADTAAEELTGSISDETEVEGCFRVEAV